jgi:Uma2 family endonuclease
VHQFAVQRLFRLVEDQLDRFGAGAVAFLAPIDVILADSEIVQPDVVVARLAQVSARGIEGAPPLLIEVTSPGRPALDREIKARRYALHGVGHYWIVDPAARTVECFRLRDGAYVLSIAGDADGVLEPPDLPGLRLALGSLWFTPPQG